MAAISRALSEVNSAWALLRPLVEITAAWSDGPIRSTSRRAIALDGRRASGIELTW